MLNVCDEKDSPLQQKRPKLSFDDKKRLGKTLAYILRYGAIREGLHVYTGGYVCLSQLLKNPMLQRFPHESVESVISNDISYRGILRFEVLQKGKHLECLTDTLVRAAYGQNLELSSLHDNCNVQRLAESALVVVCSNIKKFDLTEFRDEFIINSIIYRLKYLKQVNNSTLSCVLSPSLEVLDLEGCFITPKTLTLVTEKCPMLKVLNCRKQAYIITDMNLQVLLTGLPHLETLNLACCHHLTDTSLNTILNSLKKLRHINICGIPNFSDSGILKFVCQSTALKHIDIFDHQFTDPHYRTTLEEVALQKNIIVILKGLDESICPKTALTACIENRMKFW